MASSYTARIRLEAQATGEGLNQWGDKLSYTINRIDDAIAGYTAIALTANYPLVATNSNTAADEARSAHLKFTGTGSYQVTIPAISKSYWPNCADRCLPRLAEGLRRRS